MGLLNSLIERWGFFYSPAHKKIKKIFSICLINLHIRVNFGVQWKCLVFLQPLYIDVV